MILTVRMPRFGLHVALRAAHRPIDLPIALGPQPGDPQIIGICSEIAESLGVRPGLRVGEALARCPELELVVPDPGATGHETEQIAERIESIGAAVEIVAPGIWRFATAGIERLHQGIRGVVRQLTSVLPVGMDARIGIAPTPFSSLQAATVAERRIPLRVEQSELQEFLAPIAVDALSVADHMAVELSQLGITTLGQFADLPRAAVVERFGLEGLRAWHCARGADGTHLHPRTPPAPIEAAFHFPETIGALSALHAAARLLIVQIVAAAQGRGSTIRSIALRAWLGDGGSWTRTLTLREASTDVDRLLTVALPSLAEVSGPVDTLVIRADASGSATGRQLTLSPPGADERARRTCEAIRQIGSSHGESAVLRLVELEPWSRLPERQWALVPYDASISPDHSV